MKRLSLFLCMSFTLVLIATTQLQAQQQGRNCGPRDAIVAHLAQNYSENRRAIGLAANNAVLEVFAAESGSWTILVTTPGGPTCLVASGENFQQMDDPLVNTDEGV